MDTWEEFEGEVGTFETRDVNYAPQEFGGGATTGTIVSTFAQDLESVQVVAVYRNAEGAIIGGNYTYADFIPAGGEIGVEVPSMETIPGLASAELYVAITSLSLLD